MEQKLLFVLELSHFSPFISNASLTKELFLNCSKEAFELKR